MPIINDQPAFLVLFQSKQYDFDKTEQYVFKTMEDAAFQACELLGDYEGSDVQIIEFNIVEGYSRDISEDICRHHEELIFEDGIKYELSPEPEYVDPNKEHRLTESELGLVK